VCLVVETGLGGDVGQWRARQQEAARHVHAAARQVTVWWQPVPAGERADQVGRICM
jgi:hypothetical protein